MIQPRMHTIAIATDGSGDFTTTIRGAGPGRFLQWRYIPNTMDTGADMDLVGATTGVVLINMDNLGTSNFTKCARQPTSDVLGAASLYAAAGEPVEDFIYIGVEDLTLTVAQGGASKAGTLYLWFG